MPKEGFTSLTVGDVVYDRWHNFFEVRKNNFKNKGVGSLSGLISGILDHVSKLDGVWLSDIIHTPKDGEEQN